MHDLACAPDPAPTASHAVFPPAAPAGTADEVTPALRLDVVASILVAGCLRVMARRRTVAAAPCEHPDSTSPAA